MSSMSIDKDEDTDSTENGNQTESNLAPKNNETMNPSNANPIQNTTTTAWKWGDNGDNDDNKEEAKQTEIGHEQKANGNTSFNGFVWPFATKNNDNNNQSKGEFTFGAPPDPHPSDTNTNDVTAISFGVPTTHQSKPDTTDKNGGFVFKPSNETQSNFIFGSSNNAESTSNDNTNMFKFGVANTDNTNNNINGIIKFGAPKNDLPSNTNINNNPMGYTFGTTTDNGSNSNHDTANSTENSNNTSFINNQPFKFGAPPIMNGTITSTTFTFTESKVDKDPFAAFNAKQEKEDKEDKEDKVDKSEETKTEQKALPPPEPIIDASLIDQKGCNSLMTMFLRLHNNEWQCNVCDNYNAADLAQCAACTGERGDAPLIKFDGGETEEEEVKDDGHDYSYYDTLAQGNELLSYESFQGHPIPRYFPYQHEDKGEELDREGDATQETWTQFDDDDEDEDETKGDDDEKDDDGEQVMKEIETKTTANDVTKGNDNKNEVDDDEQVMKNNEEETKQNEEEEVETVDYRVKVYREYKRRRNECKEQISQCMSKRPKIRANDVIDRLTESIIVMAGDGSMGGQLGVGNGSVTAIPRNIASFPFMMEAKAPSKRLKQTLPTIMRKVKSIAAGIMSTAVVTYDDEIYVWGLNDKSELTINPVNAQDVDIGDDDDGLSKDVALQRLHNRYLSLITNLYHKYNPSKLQSQPQFVENTLIKSRKGTFTLKYDGAEKTQSNVASFNLTDQFLENQKTLFVAECKATDKGRKEWQHMKTEDVQHEFCLDIHPTALQMHNRFYVRVCKKYGVDYNQREQKEVFIPKATAEEMEQRRDRKLNPYKYVQEEEEGEDEDIDIAVPNYKTQDSENIEMKDIDNDNDTVSSYVYHQKGKWEEEDFQSTLSCSYWTPARVRLPHKMVVKQVTLGAAHMVVLDQLGHVYSSGTFKNETPVGHHYDRELEQIILYQRTLKAISSVESLNFGRQRNGKHNVLPPMTMIASGNDHFLMLDKKGDIWKMGVSKLGQRWCSRNVKNYLCPQRVSVIQDARGRRAKGRIRFNKIACGNHHNLAISTNGHLYAWGQNVWWQCGVPKNQSAYGCVIDQPRFVNFYQDKQNINDVDEGNISTEYTITDVVGGEHMTIALDSTGNVWSCGRNACLALGRKTRWPGMRMLDGRSVRSEVDPDVMRKVPDLAHINWIGCGSVVWFAHSSFNGAVYSFGDARNGRAGIGKWQYARGRPVFDQHNFDTAKYKVVACDGGSDHTIFLIKRRRRLSRRHSLITPQSSSSSTSNSKESSLESSLDAGLTNGINALHPTDISKNVVVDDENSNSSNHSNNSRKNGPSTHRIMNKRRGRRSRKRKRSEIAEFGNIPEESELEQIEEERSNEPKRKRMKTGKPSLNRNRARFKGDNKHDFKHQPATTPIPGEKSK